MLRLERRAAQDGSGKLLVETRCLLGKIDYLERGKTLSGSCRKRRKDTFILRRNFGSDTGPGALGPMFCLKT